MSTRWIRSTAEPRRLGPDEAGNVGALERVGRRGAKRATRAAGTPRCRTPFAALAAPVLLLAATAGCGLLGPSEAQCAQSAATVRQAVGFQDFESARKWRDYVWEVCADSTLITALDAEIVAAEQAARQQAELEVKKRQKKVAQARINAAQKHWLAFDGRDESGRTQQALDAARAAAERQSEGLPAEYAAQLASYNAEQYRRRVTGLSK